MGMCKGEYIVAREDEDGDWAQTRVFPRCEPDTNGGCWLWTGAVGRLGYGNISIHVAGVSKTFQSHRIAYGLDRARGFLVLHKCDVPACCNPAHLRAGTYADNMQDMAAKGRGDNGSQSNWQRLSPSERANIEALLQDGQSFSSIARITGRARATVKSVWQGLPQAAPAEQKDGAS